MTLLALLGCDLEPVSEPSATEPLPIEALWTSDLASGTVVTLGPVFVTSPRTTDQRYFFASDPGGGPRSGVVVLRGAVLDDWPPEVGTAVQLTVTVVRSGLAPAVELLAGDDGVVLEPGEAGQLPLPTPWSEDEELEYALVTARGLTVTSSPDPLGQADTDGGVDIGGRFGIAPGWNRTGDSTGLLVEGRISARSAADWTGELQGEAALPVALPALASLPEGTPVIIDGLSLATPWSRDARWAVAQDEQGRGIWLDGEAWGLHQVVSGPSPLGASPVGTWTGEVRHEPEGLALRVWTPPVLGAERQLAVTGALSDGALLETHVSALTPPDPYGERTTDLGLLLDDRFVDLRATPVPIDLVGAVRLEPDGQLWLAPYALGTP